MHSEIGTLLFSWELASAKCANARHIFFISVFALCTPWFAPLKVQQCISNSRIRNPSEKEKKSSSGSVILRNMPGKKIQVVIFSVRIKDVLKYMCKGCPLARFLLGGSYDLRSPFRWHHGQQLGKSDTRPAKRLFKRARTNQCWYFRCPSNPARPLPRRATAK